MHAPVVIEERGGASLSASFAPLAPATYVATAFRQTDGKTVATAIAKKVTLLPRQTHAAVKLEMHEPPTLEILEARFVGDHGVLTENPPTLLYKRPSEGREFRSTFGDGSGASNKPEYDPKRSGHEGATAYWRAASYTKGSTVQYSLRLKVVVPDGRTHNLEAFRLFGHGPKNLTATDTTVRQLVNGTTITVTMKAETALPNHIARVARLMIAKAIVDGHEIPVAKKYHNVEVFGTLGTPEGKAELHTAAPNTPYYPESGPVQSLTGARLQHAVACAAGARNADEAIRAQFAYLRDKLGIRYYSHSYPLLGKDTEEERARKLGLELDYNYSLPPLHEFLWMGMRHARFCHCLDLAAGFRLLSRMVGVTGGSMEVRVIRPWAQWDASGDLRDLSRDGEPHQGSLSRRYPHAGSGKLLFVDDSEAVNFFEAVLRWQAPGSAKAILLPVGEAHILEKYGPGVSPGPMDDRNASLYFEPKNFGLVIKEPGKRTGYRKPPFPFMTHDNQYRIRFGYRHHTNNAGDDKKPRGAS